MLLLTGRKSLAPSSAAKTSGRSSDLERSNSNKRVRFADSRRLTDALRRESPDAASAATSEWKPARSSRIHRVSFTRGSTPYSTPVLDEASPSTAEVPSTFSSGNRLLSYLTGDGSEGYETGSQEEYSEDDMQSYAEDDEFCGSVSSDETSSFEAEAATFKLELGSLPPRISRLNIPTNYQAPKKSDTMFKTDGSPTHGSRRRIRNRHQVHAAYGDQAAIESVYVDNDLPLISKDSLLNLRRAAWQPNIKTKANQQVSVMDFSVAYNVAWEIGKRGCVAFQRLPRSSLFFLIRKKYAVRFLVMDGTDGMSFLTVYRMRPDKLESVPKCAVFSAVDLMHSQWDPVEGAIKLEFYERRDKIRWRLRKEQFKAIPWNFFEAMIVCLREMSIWKAVNEELAIMRAERDRLLLEATARAKTNFEPANESKSVSSILSPQIVARNNSRNRSTAYAAPKVEQIVSAIHRARLETALRQNEPRCTHGKSSNRFRSRAGSSPLMRPCRGREGSAPFISPIHRIAGGSEDEKLTRFYLDNDVSSIRTSTGGSFSALQSKSTVPSLLPIACHNTGSLLSQGTSAGALCEVAETDTTGGEEATQSSYTSGLMLAD
eukprot:Gregarina_sp_Poly_1__8065@NODE_463_length_8191_cov_61_524372_g377_i0_p1_GENE_NODE_463_length_8191_cov_61_524372_g377_i0NODE_463_length_8191_cov_61_524372_g377_i0_p1_ORF_typecomplete_len603_score83_10_NODE_463_length_8191_cov_61_524372_g377_i030514859